MSHRPGEANRLGASRAREYGTTPTPDPPNLPSGNLLEIYNPSVPISTCGLRARMPPTFIDVLRERAGAAQRTAARAWYITVHIYRRRSSLRV